LVPIVIRDIYKINVTNTLKCVAEVATLFTFLNFKMTYYYPNTLSHFGRGDGDVPDVKLIKNLDNIDKNGLDFYTKLAGKDLGDWRYKELYHHIRTKQMMNIEPGNNKVKNIFGDKFRTKKSDVKPIKLYFTSTKNELDKYLGLVKDYDILIHEGSIDDLNKYGDVYVDLYLPICDPFGDPFIIIETRGFAGSLKYCRYMIWTHYQRLSKMSKILKTHYKLTDEQKKELRRIYDDTFT